MNRFPSRVIIDVAEHLPRIRELASQVEDVPPSEIEYVTDYYLDAIVCQLLDQDEALMNLVDYKHQIIVTEQRHGKDGTALSEEAVKLGLSIFEILKGCGLYDDNRKLGYHYALREGDYTIVLEHQ